MTPRTSTRTMSTLRQLLQLRFVLRTLRFDRLPRSVEPRAPRFGRRAARLLLPHLVQLLVQREHFFEQTLGRGRSAKAFALLCPRRPTRSDAFELQQILDARNGIAERAISVVQIRRLLQAGSPLGGCRIVEVVGMKLPTERAIALFEIGHVEVQLAGKAEETEEVGATRQMNCHSRTSISRWGC